MRAYRIGSLTQDTTIYKLSFRQQNYNKILNYQQFYENFIKN